MTTMALVGRANYRLCGHIPRRTWAAALGTVPELVANPPHGES